MKKGEYILVGKLIYIFALKVNGVFVNFFDQWIKAPFQFGSLKLGRIIS